MTEIKHSSRERVVRVYRRRELAVALQEFTRVEEALSVARGRLDETQRVIGVLHDELQSFSMSSPMTMLQLESDALARTNIVAKIHAAEAEATSLMVLHGEAVASFEIAQDSVARARRGVLR